jgi:hypothetical protein
VGNSPASREVKSIAEALVGYRGIPARYEGQLGAALTSGGALPVTSPMLAPRWSSLPHSTIRRRPAPS